MPETNFDLIVIGSGPAGQKGAICAAKLRKRVAVIDRTLMMGGVCVHTGTIPSKSVREAIFQLTGTAVKSFYGDNVSREWTIFRCRISRFACKAMVARETEVIRAQLKRNGVQIFQGMAHLPIRTPSRFRATPKRPSLRGEHVLIACGTRPAGNTEIPFDGKRILDTDRADGLDRVCRAN